MIIDNYLLAAVAGAILILLVVGAAFLQKKKVWCEF